jgi:ribosomal protein S18 acetylase RimI-like enzyme
VTDLPRIRGAADRDLTALRDIEWAAGEAFRKAGMDAVADDEPAGVEELAGYARRGHAWVAVDDADAPVAYLLADPVDGALHIEQVSVHPKAAGRGIGRALVEHLAAVARAGGVPALTLTTFVDVPWNGPYYARLGFVPMAEGEIGPQLREIRRHEAAHGLDRWPRACMRLTL